MKKNINFHEFCNEFERYNREGCFSEKALKSLYNFFEEEQPEYVLDVLEICSNFSEYTDLEKLKSDFAFDEESTISEIMYSLTIFIEFDGGYIVSNT